MLYTNVNGSRFEVPLASCAYKIKAN